ncbi:hypothetical protein GF345_04220 [Candidatus Woesearchaeota archaeon]|nr:hypothetical protein [Candidatus Woesearchaeota archaeon]
MHERIELGPVEFFGPNLYLDDPDVINLVRRKIIEPYENHPAVNDVIYSKKTITERVQPVCRRIEDIAEEYRSVRLSKKFRQEQVFGQEEENIQDELKDIIDIKQQIPYDMKIHSERAKRFFDWMTGGNWRSDKDAWKPFYAIFRNGLIPTISLYAGCELFEVSDKLSPLLPPVIETAFFVLSDLSCGALITAPFTRPKYTHKGIQKLSVGLENKTKHLDKMIQEAYDI